MIESQYTNIQPFSSDSFLKDFWRENISFCVFLILFIKQQIKRIFLTLKKM